MYKIFLKPFFFLLSPEQAHRVVVKWFELLLQIPGSEWLIRKIFCVQAPILEREVFGIHFPNPVGLAAGFDKDARHLRAMSALGFGFIEVGTVTPLPQPGNDRPRMFRLPDDEALINRMGFNNEGVDVVAARLATWRKYGDQHVIIGGNIGKNKSTPLENAISDYEICLEKLFDVVDYFVVNVSSPNTPGLRALQEKEPLKELLHRLQSLNSSKENSKPILLKIAPDLTNEQLDDIIEIVLGTNITGVIATNTTISREGLKTTQHERFGAGGLSGKPLAEQSTNVIRYLKSKSQNKFSIIGVGGIHSAKDAMEKLDAGADLVEIYTGMIYKGPWLMKEINLSLIRRMAKVD